MDIKQISATVRQICDEKNISFESVMETIEAALAAAYRKDFGDKMQNIKVEFDLESGETRVFDVKTVVEDVPEEVLEAQRAAAEAAAQAAESGEKPAQPEPKAAEGDESEEDEEEKITFNPKTEIQISDAKEMGTYSVGDEIKTELDMPTDADYGRMAAQTAKQVIIQKLREAERAVQFEDFKDREGELLVGTVHRREGHRLLIDLGKIMGVMPIEHQVRGERYNVGDRVRVVVVSVEQTTKGPSILLSRTHELVIQRLFEQEIPEISAGVVEIKSIAREPGSRSKVAVFTEDENIDPVGSCVGQKGARIQTIINELGGEKIDIIEWDEDVERFIAQAISPAKAENIELDDAEKSAVIQVLADQLSLAIGKSGQNVRLAVKLTGWDLNIQEVDEEGNVVEKEDKVVKEEKPAPAEEVDVEETPAEEQSETPAEETDEDKK